jgi:hypothetical protein
VPDPKGEKRPAAAIDATIIAKQHGHPDILARSVLRRYCGAFIIVEFVGVIRDSGFGA